MSGAYKLTEERQLTTPDLEGIPEDDYAEPLDADVQHLATHDQVAELQALEEATAPNETDPTEEDA